MSLISQRRIRDMGCNSAQIKEAEEKEPEMQIGLPTDVKHVAHIGFDGPSVSSPSWMGDFQAGSSEPQATITLPKSPSQDANGKPRSSNRDLPALPLPKPTKRSTAAAATATAAANSGDSPRTSRHSRRHHSGSASSPDNEKPDGPRRSRRDRSGTAGSDIPGYTSSSLQDSPAPSTSKHRRRKVKGSSSSSSGTSKGSRSKGAEKQLSPVFKPVRDDEDEG